MADLGTLTLGSDQPATAAMLLRDHQCTAQCLVAVEATDSCTCPCRGKHHGALARATVPGTVRRPPPATPAEPVLFDVAAHPFTDRED